VLLANHIYVVYTRDFWWRRTVIVCISLRRNWDSFYSLQKSTFSSFLVTPDGIFRTSYQVQLGHFTRYTTKPVYEFRLLDNYDREDIHGFGLGARIAPSMKWWISLCHKNTQSYTDPWGVAVDEDSNIYVTDAASHNIDCPNLTLMGN